VNDLLRILRRDNALFLEHFGMRPARRDVLAKELAVHVDGGVYVRHDGIGLGAKAAPPHLVAHGGLIRFA
jgi:hypothetical protein